MSAAVPCRNDYLSLFYILDNTPHAGSQGVFPGVIVAGNPVQKMSFAKCIIVML